MTRRFQQEFSERKRQVKRYLAAVSEAERTNRQGPLRKRSEERLNVLRAGSFLILYNLIESGARTSVEAIHDEMRLKRTPFGQLKRSIRREVIKGFKKHGKPDVHLDMIEVPIELVAAALDVEDYFSGNVDAKRIREIAAVYGFSTVTNDRITRDGSVLVTIKDIRNDLAHGFKTYDEIGRDYPIKRLLEISIRAGSYIDSVINNVATYLDAEAFRELETTVAA